MEKGVIAPGFETVGSDAYAVQETVLDTIFWNLFAFEDMAVHQYQAEGRAIVS